MKTNHNYKSLGNLFLLFFILNFFQVNGQKDRARDLGLEIGILSPGPLNSITDVPHVSVGHTTIKQGDSVRTGVTAILPHQGNIYKKKVPAAIYIGNGYGKLAGYSQVKELGNIETPLILTNTLSVPTAMEALIKYTLDQKGNENVRSVNAVVGETNDGRLNDIRGMHVNNSHILNAINTANENDVSEGNIGAGTGNICFGFKGGIGTSSRKLPKQLGGYTVGVLVQSNFGGVLEINGIPVAKELGITPYQKEILSNSDGSCMIVIITDAPVDNRNLERMAKRGMLGIAKTGGIASNGSGDYIIAMSNNPGNLISTNSSVLLEQNHLRNNDMSPLFLAVIEATEEAIVNSLIAAEDMTANGKEIKALPIEKLKELIKDYKK